MPLQLNYPGVYIQETPTAPGPIQAGPTSFTAFMGYAGQGPAGTATRCIDWQEYQSQFGDLDPDSPLSFQVFQYFQNGGIAAWVLRLAAVPGGADIVGDAAARTGIHAFDTVETINLIVLPDLPGMNAADYQAAATAALDYAASRKAFVILDLPATVTTPAQALDWAGTVPATLGANIINAAAYFPQVLVTSQGSSTPIPIAPSGTMAGVYAESDVNVGVWKAPAGVTASLMGVESLAYLMNDTENGMINPLGINALRVFPSCGCVAWGARTLAGADGAGSDWTYVNVRRLALYIENSVTHNLQWAVFEPNDPALWSKISTIVGAFLEQLFQQGALAGSTAASAYQVRCDATTTTPEDIAQGIVNIVITIAPVMPGEFIVLHIQQMAGQSAS